MKTLHSILCFFLLIILSISCKDDDTDKTPPTPAGSCILQSETTNLNSNNASWKYEYDASGHVSKINRFNVYGSPDRILSVNGGIITNATIPGPAVQFVEQSYVYEGGNLIDGRPTKVSLSLTVDDESQVNYKTYFFFYDAKGRLETIGEQTDFVMGDLEWDLHITYNDQDNVTGLYYEITTGPANTGSKISVEKYDDKPTPYAGIPNWKFLMNNFAWDNYDPEPILTALSKNNPLDYALNKGTEGEYLRTMTYEYNDKGYPLKRTNVNKNKNGEYTFVQTFTYTCQ